MKQQLVFDNLLLEMQGKLNILEDKPEENLNNTLKALWLLAAEIRVSVEVADKKKYLPELEESQIKQLHKLVSLRLSNVPLAYITGRQNFMGIELLTDKRALIPRKETEILAQKAIEFTKTFTKKQDIKVLDICCGAGNLGIAIAHYNSGCHVYASDLSEDAVQLAIENVNFTKLTERVEVFQGDMLSPFNSSDYFGKIDMIVCNPPYILGSKVKNMDPEISNNEPELAFNGGMLGTTVIQKLVKEAPAFLTEKAAVIFEVGLGQGKFLAEMIARSGAYKRIETITDKNSNIRVISCEN
jgi:release factor glutamine methyltransferase